MKYLIYPIAILMVSCSNSSQTDENLKPNMLPAEIVVLPYTDDSEISYGVQKLDDVIIAEGDIKNNRQHGAWTTYDSKGIVNSVISYNEGLLQGLSLTFDKQGYIESKANYFRGELHGEYLLYKRKKVIERRTYQFGALSGIVTKYYDNGNLMQETPYIDGQLNGLGKWYDQEGNLTIAYLYEDGELIDMEPDLD